MEERDGRRFRTSKEVQRKRLRGRRSGRRATPQPMQKSAAEKHRQGWERVAHEDSAAVKPPHGQNSDDGDKEAKNR